MVQLKRAVIAQLREAVGEGAFTEIACDFVKDSKRLESALRRAAKDRNAAAAKASAHELRGLAAIFGAEALAKCCADLESAAGNAVLKAATRATRLCGSTRSAIERLARETQAGAA
jgi:HPt (histidine-containing phosphotransfer) domain-containing protein